ncbi:MAG: rifampicin phosphotransferase [Nocardioidaceae bacterium]|nr:rifampicin phosphotransferase [Nocardioidaceae bacterium]
MTITSRVTDPLHQPGGPKTYWTTINAEENLPGVVTPLSGSFWIKPVTVGTLGAFVELGVLPESAARMSEDVDERICSVIFGRFCANIDLIRACADKTPGTSGDAVELQLFANVRPGIPKQGAPWRYPIVGFKAPRAAAGVAGWMQREFDRSQDWWRRSIAQVGSDDVVKARLRLQGAQDNMTRVMRPHTLGTFITQGVLDQVRVLVESAGRPDLLLELSRGGGSLEETEMLEMLWEVSRGRVSVETFLGQYGFHGPGEAAASATVWRENPAALDSVLETYRSMSEDRAPHLLAPQVAAQRAQASAELMATLPRRKRPVAKFLLSLSDKMWPLRETGKATLLHSIDVGRASARRIGEFLVKEGRIGEVDDVAYLTVDELVADDGRADWHETVAVRRAKREEYLLIDLPQTWEGVPATTRVDARAAATGAAELVAISGSPGVAEGVVRIVRDPMVDEFDDGEVLVCETTDPSWASLFLAANALVIDVGSPMSHGAIVARELGLPCVINTRTGTRELRTGDRVRVDGTRGRVQILSRAETT